MNAWYIAYEMEQKPLPKQYSLTSWMHPIGCVVLNSRSHINLWSVDQNDQALRYFFREWNIWHHVLYVHNSLVRATKDNEHADLYHCLPWSHGTLGFLVALELAIVPVKPYVRMEYIPVRGQKAYCDKIRELSGANDKDAKVIALIRFLLIHCTALKQRDGDGACWR